MPKEEPQQPAVPDIPSLRAPDHRGLGRFFSHERTSSTISLILIPLALGALGGTGLIAVVRWGGGEPSRSARSARAASEPSASARPASMTEREAAMVQSALERSAGIKRIHDPSPLDATGRVAEWPHPAYAGGYGAAGAGSMASAAAGAPDGYPEDRAMGETLPEPAEGQAPAAGAAPSADGGEAAGAGEASLSGRARGAASGNDSVPERPKLELYPGSKGFSLRVNERDSAPGNAPRAGARKSDGYEAQLASFREAAAAAKESSQAAAASAGEFRRSVESLDLNFRGPWQQDPVLRELHDAVSSAKRAGLDAASRLDAYAAELMAQSNALQVDLAQAVAFGANPYARQVPPVTAQQVPPAPDISAQLAEIARAKSVIDRLKDQVPRGM